ncbi:hypothetical protein GCM10022221_62950 [Actinocorallia aurea]
MTSRLTGPKSAKPLLVLLLVAVVSAAGAVLLSRQFVSPQQRAADAAPPKESVITVDVESGVLSAETVIRADVTEVDPVLVKVPTGLGASLPVVTAVRVERGQRIGAGTLLMTVAEQPVFVFEGDVPAFRDMVRGTKGVDVEQLQDGLRSVGHPIGGDTRGVFGPGTAAAVAALARAAGVVPATAADTPSTAPEAGAAEEPEEPFGQAQTERAPSGPVVLRGQVVFVPRLPARVVALPVRKGSLVKDDGTLAKIGTGRLVLTGTVDAGTRETLKVGTKAVAKSSISGDTVRLRVAAIAARPKIEAGVPSYAVRFAPLGAAPLSMAGENVAVTIGGGRTTEESLIVPIAAISTDASGRTFVTVVEGGARRSVEVRLGQSIGGRQAVTPVEGELDEGDPVLVGTTAGPSSP